MTEVSYFDKCKKRIESSNIVDKEEITSYNLSVTFYVKDLEIHKIVNPNGSGCVRFRGVEVPLTQDEVLELYKVAKSKYESLDRERNLEILSQL